MKITVAICAILVWVCVATAQSLNEVSRYILDSSMRTETSKELAAIVAAAPTPRSETALWTDAVALSRSMRANNPAGRAKIAAKIARLMEAALIGAGVEPDTLPLDKLSHDDIVAMHNTVGFPDPGDLLLYLLRRGPSLRDAFMFESYTAMRFIPEGMPYRYLSERADRVYLGVGTEFEMKRLDPSDDPVLLNSYERCKTRRLNLAALPDIVLAAKTFRAFERAPKDYAVFPLLIAVEAVNGAFSAYSRDFEPVVYSTERKVLETLRGYGAANPFLLAEENRFKERVPRTAFFTRQFAAAAKEYGSLRLRRIENRLGKLQAAWGEALSLFAYGAEASPAFDHVAALISADAKEHLRIFGWFLDYLPANEAERLGNVDSWRARVVKLLGQAPDQATGAAELKFVQFMERIGRPDIASRFLMDRIRSVRELGRLERVGSIKIKLQQRESLYLRSLAPFVRDFYYTISFRLSGDQGWIRRKTGSHDGLLDQGYSELLDFLDNVNSSGQFVGPGEVVVSNGSHIPHPALNPEEDMTVAENVYGIVEISTPDDKRAGIVAGFERWVRNAMSRRDSGPSIVPYLKLIWLEWFSQAFEALKVPSPRASEFHYDAIRAC